MCIYTVCVLNIREILFFCTKSLKAVNACTKLYYYTSEQWTSNLWAIKCTCGEDFDKCRPTWLNCSSEWQHFNSWITHTLDGWLVAVWACFCQYEWLIRLKEQMGCGRHFQEAGVRNNGEKTLNEWDTTILKDTENKRHLTHNTSCFFVTTSGKEQLGSTRHLQNTTFRSRTEEQRENTTYVL